MKNSHLAIVSIALVVGAMSFLFIFTPCTEVDTVTFGADIEFGDNFKINPNITKDCISQFAISSIPAKVIDELKSLKVDLLRTIHTISTLEEKTASLEEEINFILEYPESQRSQWHNEYLSKMQQELKIDLSRLEYAQQELPKITKQFEEKFQSIKITARSEDEVKEVIKEIDAINFFPLIEFDQKIYTWTDKVYVTIIDVMGNLDAHKFDTIGGRDDRILKVETSRGVINNVILMETARDTAIFTTEIILTGFKPYDVDGDGNLDDVNGYTSYFATSDGDGKISAGPLDKLTVTYEFLEGEIVTATSEINWNIAEIQFLDAILQKNSEEALRVIAVDANLDPESIDTIHVSISSSSDQEGFEMELIKNN